MSDHVFPVNGGCKFTESSHTVGVWAEETPLGIALFAGVNDPSQGWQGNWSHGPMLDDQMQSEITAAGGIVPYIASFAAAINAEIAQIYGTAAPPTATLTDQLNAALLTSFELVLGPNGPIFQKKP